MYNAIGMQDHYIQNNCNSEFNQIGLYYSVWYYKSELSRKKYSWSEPKDFEEQYH